MVFVVVSVLQRDEPVVYIEIYMRGDLVLAYEIIEAGKSHNKLEKQESWFESRGLRTRVVGRSVNPIIQRSKDL